MRVEEVLKKKLSEIKVSGNEEQVILKHANAFLLDLNKNLKRLEAKAVLGGSFSKGTAVKKKYYDVDIFVRFPRKSKNISELLQSVLKKMKLKFSRLPGSRDYFSINVKEDGAKFKIELVPVVLIKKPKEALNVTDVSPLHVSYVKSKTKKNKKLADEIRLAKAFCFAQDCYGAESYIKGFSGYCLEVLTIYYGSFVKFVRGAVKWDKMKKLVIDPAKHYPKNAKVVFKELNEAKLMSPLVLIDPVQKDRNASAALSYEKFYKLSKVCKSFLKRPSLSYFEKKEIDEEKLAKEAKKKKYGLFRIDTFSNKLKEDISGAKLLKLHGLMELQLKKEGYVFKSLFEFDEKYGKHYFIITKKPKEFIQQGPPVKLKQHAVEFKKRWKKYSIKSGRLIAKRKVRSVQEMLKIDDKRLQDMGINSFKISEWA
ncbi:nucleotidyltransferase domain-containing protein [Nanoarchaeota archaeon]